MFFGTKDLLRLGSILELFVIAGLLLGGSTLPVTDGDERVRAFTREIEFNFLGWTLDAFALKFDQFALGANRYLPDETNAGLVLDYSTLVREIQQLESEIQAIYADPEVDDPDLASAELRQKLKARYAERSQLGPLAENILQSQLQSTLTALGITLGGQSIPPVLFHSTPLPRALIVSPRHIIRQDNNILIVPDLTLDEQVQLEDEVAEALDVSTLVVPVGGIGTYPTMVAQSSNLNWLAEVVAHEWVHNYLTPLPLGLSYLDSPELRTMNETAASIAGKEIGRAVIAAFFPELLPPPPTPTPPERETAPPPEPVFDFNAEMRTTRVNVDRMLAEGKIEEAETYMEVRRRFFWENGYRIRKLNQAYFAFYGAYADVPGGAAGEDPVGAAVRKLRAQSPSLAAFLKTIAWMSSFEQLQQAVGE